MELTLPQSLDLNPKPKSLLHVSYGKTLRLVRSVIWLVQIF